MNLAITLPLGLAALLPLLQEPASRPARKEPPLANPAVLKIGDKLPADLKLKDLDGNEMTPESLKGKVVCFTFWSITCPIMIGKEPELLDLTKFCREQKDVVFFAVNSNQGNGELDTPADAKGKDAYPRIRAYMKQKNMAFRVIADHDSVFANLLDARTTPHCYVFDKDGVLRYGGGIDDNPQNNKETPQLYPQDAITACLAGKEPKVSTAKPYGCSIKRPSAGGPRR